MAYLRKLTAILVSLAVGCSFIPVLAENESIPEAAGKVRGASSVEIKEDKKIIEDVLQVIMPYEAPFRIVVSPGTGDAWIESDEFTIENLGEGDVIVKFKNIHYNFISDDNFKVAYHAEDVKDVTDMKAIFMKINASGNQISSTGCVMSNEAADSGEIEFRLAGNKCENEENIASFNFSGAVNIPEGISWESDDVEVSVEYEIYKADSDEHEQFVVPENTPEPTEPAIIETTVPMDNMPESTIVPIIESTIVPIESPDGNLSGGSLGGSSSSVNPQNTPVPTDSIESTIVPIIESTIVPTDAIESTTVPIIESTVVPIEPPSEDNTNNSESSDNTDDAAEPSDNKDNTIIIGGKDDSSDSHKSESSGSDASENAAASSDSGSGSSDNSSGSSDSGSGSSDSGSGSSDSGSGSSDSGSSSSDSGSGSSDSGSGSSNSSSGSSDSGSGSSNSSSGSSDGGSSSSNSSSGSSDSGSGSSNSSSGSSDSGSSSSGDE